MAENWENDALNTRSVEIQKGDAIYAQPGNDIHSSPWEIAMALIEIDGL